MAKLESSRAGMAQMAMYIYQAFIEQGLTPEAAKRAVAAEIEKLHVEYTTQAGIPERKLPKSVATLAQEAYRYAKEMNNGSIAGKYMERKTADVIEAIKRG